MKEKLLKIWGSDILFAFLLNAFFLAISILFTSFSYDGTADYYSSVLISQKHFYTNSGVNYILAVIIGTIQYALPGINCFVLFEVLASFAAFTSITFVFADKFNKRKALIFTILLNIMFALQHYASVNSYRTAALLCAAGFLLILLAVYQKRYSFSCWVGVVEVLFGSFLNITYFFVALGFGIAFFFGDLIAKKKYRLPFRKLFWYFRPFLLMFLLVTALTLGLSQFSFSVNHATNESTEFYEYSAAQTSVNTLPYPSYSDHIEEFEKAGITSEADYTLLKNGYYDSDNSLNANAIKTVREIQQKENPKDFGSAAYSIFEDNYVEAIQFDRSIIVIAVYLTVSLVFILYHKNRFSFFPLFYFIVGYLSSFLIRLFYNNTENLTYGIWVFMIAMLLNSFNFELERKEHTNKLRQNNGYLIISASIVIGLAVLNGVIYYNNMPKPAEENESRFLISELDRNPDCYYVMDPDTKEDFIKTTTNYIHPMWGFDDSYLSNLDDFGYFHNEQILRKRNLSDNIYQALLSKKKIYVIDNNIVFKKEKYFSEHYTQNNARAYYELVSEPQGYKIYKVMSNQ